LSEFESDVSSLQTWFYVMTARAVPLIFQQN